MTIDTPIRLARFRFALVSALACSTLSASATTEDPTLVAPTPPRSPEEQQAMFHLPAGFRIQLFAAEPDIAKPMNIAFDDRSRLWVTSSLEYPFPVQPGATPRDSIRILEDTDGDGRADRTTTFADGLNIPIGVLPISAAGRTACVAYSIPHILRLEDRDGDDRADSREILFRNFGYQDTHGMASSFTHAPDGWIYATHGFANTSEVRGGQGEPVKMHSGNTFRFRPDGSQIQQYTWGQVNPFGLAFDPLGNLYSADCHSRPIYMLLRGAYYPSFGKPHDGLGFGPEMCTHEHGSTGIAGIVYYDADHFPPEFRDTIFTGNPVTNRINHDRLERHGSTLIATHLPDFLRCDDPWFRPVALALGPDGALYVADFYNRIIGHYEVPLTHPGRDRERGRIWRITYEPAPPDTHSPPASPGPKSPAPRRDWTTASTDELITELASPNITRRSIAQRQLVTRAGPAAIEPLRRTLRSKVPANQAIGALWSLEQLDALDDELLAAANRNALAPLRTHALRVLAERPVLAPNLRALAVEATSDSDAFARRAAADALARHPSGENLTRLLQLRRTVPADDTHLLHATRIAIREQLRDAAILAAAIELPEKDHPLLADAACGVPGDSAALFLLRHLQSPSADPSTRLRLLAQAARYTPADQLEAAIAAGRSLAGTDPRRQAETLRTLHESIQARGGTALPASLTNWAEQTAMALFSAGEPPSIADALQLVRTMKLAALRDPVVPIANGSTGPPGARGDAISTLAAIDPPSSVPILLEVLRNGSESTAVRQHTASLLGQLNRPDARDGLVVQLRTAPEAVAVHIAAALAGSRPGAELLLGEITTGKASPRLLQHPLVLGRLRAAAPPDLERRVAALVEALPPAEERFQTLIAARRAAYAASRPDMQRGAAVFEKHCAACHSAAGRGAKIGPQLDGIGMRGVDRLLEDVLDPNRNVDQAFRATVLALKNGQIVSGLVLAVEGDTVRIADTQGKELRIAQGDIEEQTVSKLSAMPANVAELVPEGEFFDLIAYLLSLRGEPANSARIDGEDQ